MSVTLECCHHVTYYVVGLFGYNFLLMLPWNDGDVRAGVMLAGGDCLPEHVNLEAMFRNDGSKYSRLVNRSTNKIGCFETYLPRILVFCKINFVYFSL